LTGSPASALQHMRWFVPAASNAAANRDGYQRKQLML